MFSLWYIDWVRELLCEPNFLGYFCIRNYIWTQGEVLSTANVLSPPSVDYASDCSKAVVLMWYLVCMAFWFLLRGVSCWVMPYSLFTCFAVLFSIAITSLGEERESWSVSFSCICLFILHTSISVFFLFLLVSETGCGLWLWDSLDSLILSRLFL